MAGDGNNGNHGKKGRSGRKSAIVEYGIAKTIKEAFEVGIDVDKLEEIARRLKTKGKKGTIRLIDIALYKAVKGEKILDDMTKKLMPDHVIDDTVEKESPAVQIIKAMLEKPKPKRSLSKRPSKK